MNSKYFIFPSSVLYVHNILIVYVQKFLKGNGFFLGSALMASALAKALSNIADSDEDMELSLSYMENSK